MGENVFNPAVPEQPANTVPKPAALAWKHRHVPSLNDNSRRRRVFKYAHAVRPTVDGTRRVINGREVYEREQQYLEAAKRPMT
jgi:hypothetical protein